MGLLPTGCTPRKAAEITKKQHFKNCLLSSGGIKTNTCTSFPSKVIYIFTPQIKLYLNELNHGHIKRQTKFDCKAKFAFLYLNFLCYKKQRTGPAEVVVNVFYTRFHRRFSEKKHLVELREDSYATFRDSTTSKNI